MTRALRYDNLVREIDRAHPRRILEVGTCKGERAEAMIRAAVRHRADVEYYGFDLFEPPPAEEFSPGKQPWPVQDVARRLSCLGAYVHLTKGDTRETLPECRVTGVDLAFIDGGHSDETVRSDFYAVLPCLAPGATIMLDDYWNYPGGGGCNALVDALDRSRFSVEMLEPVDEFGKSWGTLRTQMVRVRRL